MPSIRKRPPPAPPPRRVPGLFLWIGLALLMIWLWQGAIDGFTVETVPYSEFKTRLSQGDVAEITVAPEVIEGTFVPEEGEEDGQAFRTIRVEDEQLVEQLEAAGVEFVGRRPSLLSQILLAWILPIGIIALLWIMMARRMRDAAGSAMSFGRNRAKIVADRDTGVTFDDVAGCEEAKHELQEVVRFLKEPDRFRALGARIPKGVLLVGAPGTGKTLMARAVAGEAKVPFYSMSGSDFVEMFVGVGAARVRDLFEQASTAAPCIVFIDELDAIGRQRGAHVGVVNDEREQTLNQLLVELDGFEPNQGVILLAATNRPDVLDRALLRPGRFDRQVVLDAPDVDGRIAILRVHLKDKPLAQSVDVTAIARGTPGFAGADLANAVNEAALLAARREASEITQRDLEDAVEKVVAGPERRSRRLTARDRERVAIHEVGHAIVASVCRDADPVHKITIVPRGRAALGYTLQLPADERLLITRSQLLDRIRAALGGRAAEELEFGEVSSGAQNDLEKATALARQMVTMFGMSDKIGLAYVANPEGSPFAMGPDGPHSGLDCSPATARDVDEEVRELLRAAYAEALAILEDRRAALRTTADALLERETLDRAEFEALAGVHRPRFEEARA